MVCRVNAGCPEPFRDCNDWLMMNVYYLINTWGTNLKCVINGDPKISNTCKLLLHTYILATNFKWFCTVSYTLRKVLGYENK